MSRAAIPSPTAEPSCLVDPERTSPAAKTPGRDVSMVGLVTRNPPASRSTASPRKPLLGFSPMNTKAAAAGNRRISPLSRSRATTAANRPRSPSSSTMSTPVRTANCGSDRTRSWRTGEADRPERASTRTRLANSDRCRPSSRAELPPPITTTSSAPL